MDAIQVTKESRPKSSDFQAKFAAVLEKLHEYDSLIEAWPFVEKLALEILNAERITVYQKGKNDQEIISKYKSGTEIKEIKVALSPSSIAGYVAMSQSMVAITNAYDEQELLKIHPQLQFSRDFDKQSGFTTGSLLAVPIKFQGVLLGVLQVLNRRGGGRFTADECARAEKIATSLGQKFRYEFKGTSGPFDYLVQTKKIKAEQLTAFQRRASKEGVNVIQLLLRDGGVSKLEVGASLEHFYQVPFQPFDPALKIPRHFLKGINESYLLKQLWVPIEAGENSVTILIDNPTDARRLMEIQRAIPAAEYIIKVGLPDDILRFLGQNIADVADKSDLHDLVGKLQTESEERIEAAEVVDENTGTIIQLVNRLILEAYESRASDIHIEPGKGRTETSVRFRIDGVCRPHLSIPASHVQAVISRIKIISGLDISERRKPQDGKCLVKFRSQPIELRVATLPTVNGESVVMRILASSEPLPVAKMNFSSRNKTEIERLLRNPHGILLVVGPTGSGKTTTLHSLLGQVNTPERKIWTAEDPVEITQPGLHQVQVNPKVGLTFSTALRAFLRADPDVIMIGEMRDQETAHAGIEASLTGHLVFSTLHTNSAPETLVRLLDLGLDPINFADALVGVLAQRLARTLCKDCKEPYVISDVEAESIRLHYGEDASMALQIAGGKTTLHKPKGCKECGGTGYKGRIGVHELLVATPKLKNLISRRANVTELRDAAVSEGMTTLMQDGILKILDGLTDLDQIKKVTA